MQYASIPDSQQEVINLFKDWINQRPNLDPYNYGFGSVATQEDYKRAQSAYTREQRAITSQLHRARKALIEFASLPYSKDIMQGAMTAFSGRLEFATNKDGSSYLYYCTGQYFPTEYRLAAAVVLERYAEIFKS